MGSSTNDKPTVPSKTVLKGTVSAAVADLQEMLNWFIDKKLITATKLAVDKSFGSKTKNAVMIWQKAAKAKGYYTGEIDGSFGPKSKAAAKAWLADL